MLLDQKVGDKADRPWERVGPELGALLTPELPSLADEVIAEIGRSIVEYRRPIEGAFGRGLRIGVQRALQQFVDLLGRPGGDPLEGRSVYRELGRGELAAGRGLDALQAAYRLGARLSWRRLSEVSRRAGADAATVSLLAESIFAYIEEISASSVEGYAQAQAESAGERERRRRRLVRLLVEGPDPPEERSLRVAALDAGWSPPVSLAALVCDLEDVGRLTTLIGPEAIGARVDELTCVLVPEPRGPGGGAEPSGPGGGELRGELERALARAAPDRDSWRAVLGPPVPCLDARLSFARAREGLRLQERGLLPPDGLLTSSEHLLTLLLHHDPPLAAEIVERRLGPLQELAPAPRRRLEQTLLSWLRHQGNIPPVALELHIHRQTVRYRLGRLRELFGEALEDPEQRLEIELALRITRAGAA